MAACPRPGCGNDVGDVCLVHGCPGKPADPLVELAEKVDRLEARQERNEARIAEAEGKLPKGD